MMMLLQDIVIGVMRSRANSVANTSDLFPVMVEDAVIACIDSQNSVHRTHIRSMLV